MGQVACENAYLPTTTTSTTTSTTAGTSTSTTTTFPPAPDLRGAFTFSGTQEPTACAPPFSVPAALTWMLTITYQADNYLAADVVDPVSGSPALAGFATWPTWELVSLPCPLHAADYRWCVFEKLDVHGDPHLSPVPATVTWSVIYNDGTPTCAILWSGQVAP